MIKKELDDLRDIITWYGPNNDFNMNKTGYFFKVLPKRGYIHRKDAKISCGTEHMELK